jgi:hypothetical protein
MEWIRRRPKVAAAAGGLAVLVVLTLVWLLARTPETKDDGPIAYPSGLPTETATRAPLKELPSATASPTTAAEARRATKKAFDQFGQSLAAGGGLSAGGGSGTLEMPGMQGGSVYKYLPKHRVTMRVTSEAPIGTIGYVVPTSLRNSSGVVKNVGTSWTLTTTAYGDPDYARLYMQAGARGFPVTCTITVDGKVTEKRSTEGPYGQLICQG